MDQYIARGLCSVEQVAAMQLAQTQFGEANAAAVLALADKNLACEI